MYNILGGSDGDDFEGSGETLSETPAVPYTVASGRQRGPSMYRRRCGDAVRRVPESSVVA